MVGQIGSLLLGWLWLLSVILNYLGGSLGGLLIEGRDLGEVRGVSGR